MNLQEQRTLVTTYIETALQRWATTGYDDAHGTFIEALDFDANPLGELDRRGRVQARQIYVYALAHLWGFDPAGKYLALAERAWKCARPIYLTAEGGWIFSARPSGDPVNTECYVYERAFTIMALSALYHATGVAEYAAQVGDAWSWIETYCKAEHGGFNLGVPFDPSAPREQNPHMHMFEACLEAGDIEDGLFKDQADTLYALASKHFITPSGALLEFFTQDWHPDPKTGADLQPGHLMEWTWLLTQYEKKSGRDVPQIERLYNAACAWGLDANGFGVDEIREGGEVLRGTKRLWVQCEVLKGHLARYEKTQEPLYLERAQNIIAGTFEHYLHAQTGSWYDQLDETQKNISKNAPASSLYHLFIALHEFLRVTG